ncbi:hypothetical protein ABZX90_09920 [Streptomyces sp. NPDC002935]|uniref:hypothetical protein n=1 Tax=Streptomyces sp. NPDC002935 TaxID=3154545 RepID=UPI0033B64822
MTTGTEALVRRAYRLAKGDVLDVQGFASLVADNGVFNGIGGVIRREIYRGERHLPRTVRDARRGDPADGGQARHPDR